MVSDFSKCDELKGTVLVRYVLIGYLAALHHVAVPRNVVLELLKVLEGFLAPKVMGPSSDLLNEA